MVAPAYLDAGRSRKWHGSAASGPGTTPRHRPNSPEDRNTRTQGADVRRHALSPARGGQRGGDAEAGCAAGPVAGNNGDESLVFDHSADAKKYGGRNV